MKVAHENQRKSAQTWMGCRDTLIDPDQRQYLKNSRLDEELEDLDQNDDEEDHYFEIDERAETSSFTISLFNTSWITYSATLYLSLRLF
jgi:hypothetical protein